MWKIYSGVCLCCTFLALLRLFKHFLLPLFYKLARVKLQYCLNTNLQDDELANQNKGMQPELSNT